MCLGWGPGMLRGDNEAVKIALCLLVAAHPPGHPEEPDTARPARRGAES